VALFDLNPVVTQDLVDIYRRELDEVWSIQPAARGEQIDSRLEPRERKEWHAFMRKLAGGDARAEARFYDWLSSRRRVGAIHSYKWAEILVNGVWAAAIVTALAPERTLDLGCNVGYWTTWMAREHVVAGVDRARPAISLARTVARELGRPAEFIEEDFSAVEVAGGGFDCVVSLQGLVHEFSRGNYAAVQGAASQLRPGGHLAMVEGGVFDGDDARALDAALHAAGLSIVATSVCRGIGFAEQPWGYIGAVAVKDSQGDGSLAGWYDDPAHERLSAWAEALPNDRWPEMNSAYMWAATPTPVLTCLRPT
jgi:SAM-dependent methyltransferase